MAFESCDVVKKRESTTGNILLVETPRSGETVAKTLIQQRKESEVGPGGEKAGERSYAEKLHRKKVAAAAVRRGKGEGNRGKSGHLRSQRKAAEEGQE